MCFFPLGWKSNEEHSSLIWPQSPHCPSGPCSWHGKKYLHCLLSDDASWKTQTNKKVVRMMTENCFIFYINVSGHVDFLLVSCGEKLRLIFSQRKYLINCLYFCLLQLKNTAFLDFFHRKSNIPKGIFMTSQNVLFSLIKSWERIVTHFPVYAIVVFHDNPLLWHYL